jgi:hypothetical protein
MNKTEQRFKDWLISKMPHPEKLDVNDHKMMDFFIGFFLTSVPQFLGVMFMFSLLSYMYLWGYRKYGFDRTLIVLLVSMIISISQVGKAVRDLTKT